MESVKAQYGQVADHSDRRCSIVGKGIHSQDHGTRNCPFHVKEHKNKKTQS